MTWKHRIPYGRVFVHDTKACIAALIHNLGTRCRRGVSLTPRLRYLLKNLSRHIALHGFWPVEELAVLADGPTGCGEVARGGCVFAWNLTVTRSTVFTEAERTRTNMTGLQQCCLAPSLPFESSAGLKTVPCTICWVVPRARLDTSDKVKISRPCRKSCRSLGLERDLQHSDALHPVHTVCLYVLCQFNSERHSFP